MLSIILGLLGLLAVIFFILNKSKNSQSGTSQKKEQKPLLQKKKQDLGQIQIFFASQTGTAAKMAENFAQELNEHGFSGVVIDLKNLSHDEFKKNQISVFFMANTGEGQAPDNCVTFMQILKGKQQIDGASPKWENMSFTVFGLGDTQYEHFNKIGIDTDRLLQKNGSKRIYQIGLGDNNSSIEDDYLDWKQSLWEVLKNYRKQNPYIKQEKMKRKISSQNQLAQGGSLNYLSKIKPTYANFKFFILKKKPQNVDVIEDELDFKTKAGLKSVSAKVLNIVERRQNTKYGSTLQLQVGLQNQPQYQTAGNIALWPQNDPKIIKQIKEFFNLNLENFIDLQVINESKKIKLNFVRPLTIRKLLEEYLDLQFRITKGLLKKLSKFQSDSPAYFLNNSSAKTTQQYKRLSEKEFCYLFKLLKEHNVKISFQDFVELSDSVGPRLFTIASSWKAQKNVIIAASIIEQGLISKHFLRQPKGIRAELRNSSFKDCLKWKKVICVSAGTGFAPFRGFLQQKQFAMKQNKQVPLLTVYFGCKERDSDYIYRSQIQEWSHSGVIDKLELAFSRQTATKVYVQHLLEKNKNELQEYIKDGESALYICGSVGMGGDVTKAILNYIIESGQSNEQAKNTLQTIEKEGRLIKELW